jgi:hypothetical protein
MRITHGDTTVELIRREGVLFASTLLGNGETRNFLKVIRDLQELSKIETIYIAVDVNAPKFKKLVDVYMRYGGIPTHLLMKIGE